MGGTYGGYMTNWIIGRTRDFKAAITDRCVANLSLKIFAHRTLEPFDFDYDFEQNQE